MSHREPAEELYQKLLAMHEDAFAAGRFDVAYHVLAAALHAAEEVPSIELLMAVRDLAEQRQKALDAMEPQHRLSSLSAGRRGHTPQYTALATIAMSVKGRIEADNAVERGHRAMGKRGVKSPG
ncbi:MAG TPA: hypothetical protein VIM84_14475 [Gemmatimonadales bacterium]